MPDPIPHPPESPPAPSKPDEPVAAAPTGKGKGKRKRPPIALPEPRDADAILALNPWELDRLVYETTLRLGRAKRHRAQLIQSDTTNGMALHSVNGEVGWLGSLSAALMQRRGQLRAQARQALGRMPTRAEAIAVAVDQLVSGPLYKLLQREADRIEAQAAKDLAQPPDLTATGNPAEAPPTTDARPAGSEP